MTEPVLARNTETGRVYTIDGADYEGVTSVIGILDKGGLMYWAARVVAEKAWAFLLDGPTQAMDERQFVRIMRDEPEAQRDEAARLGNEVHHHAEVILKSRLTPEDAAKYAKQIADLKVRRRVQQFVKWYTAHKVEPLEVEVTVCSDEFGYAGSADLMARIDDGAIYIIDFKTSKNLYPTVSLQASAYAWADCIVRDGGTKEPNLGITKGAVLHIKPMSYRFVEVDIKYSTFQVFTDLLKIKRRWVDGKSSTAIGGDILPAKA